MAISLASASVLLFDVDGTIAETERDGHLTAFNRAFVEFGIPWRWTNEVYGQLLKVTGGFERMQAYAQQMQGQAISVDWDEALFRQVHQRKNSCYAELLKTGGIRPRSGFIDLVQHVVARGQRWGVVTTTSHANWSALWRYAIQSVRPLPAPDVVICGEDVSRKKPDPEAYALALQRMGVAASRCIAIEDSRNGLIAAMGAGIPTVIVRSEYFRGDDFAGAACVVEELTTLLSHYN